MKASTISRRKSNIFSEFEFFSLKHGGSLLIQKYTVFSLDIESIASV